MGANTDNSQKNSIVWQIKGKQYNLFFYKYLTYDNVM